MKRLINLPNSLTVSRILLTPIFLVLFFSESWYWKYIALGVFIVASLTDFYDGYLARKEGNISEFGRFLDPLADKVLVWSALMAFVVEGVIEKWLVVVIVGRDVIVTALRLMAIQKGTRVNTSKLAKWKTTMQLAVVLVILAFITLKVTLVRFKYDYSLFKSPHAIAFLNGLVGAVVLVTLISGARYFFTGNRSSVDRVKA